jgi:hypothetical protein
MTPIEALGNWHGLNKMLKNFSEEEVLSMLEFEKISAKRHDIIDRLHTRYTMLKLKRERAELKGMFKCL